MSLLNGTARKISAVDKRYGLCSDEGEPLRKAKNIRDTLLYYGMVLDVSNRDTAVSTVLDIAPTAFPKTWFMFEWDWQRRLNGDIKVKVCKACPDLPVVLKLKSNGLIPAEYFDVAAAGWTKVKHDVGVRHDRDTKYDTDRLNAWHAYLSPYYSANTNTYMDVFHDNFQLLSEAERLTCMAFVLSRGDLRACQ